MNPGASTGYLPRIVDSQLDELLCELPAVAIKGPKGVGKTATALRRSRTVYRFDQPAQHEVAAADPNQVLQGELPILLDEWQRVPAVWDAVRRAVDADPAPNRYLLTGSATPTAPPTHSGAGRIVTVRMRPLALSERGVATPTVSLRELLLGRRPPITGTSDLSLADYTHEIVASGFPSLRHLSAPNLYAQLDGYVMRIVDQDFPEQGYQVRRPQTLLQWMQAYAAATATTASYEKIRGAATSGDGVTPAKSTTQPYRDTLQRLWIVDPVPAWLPSRNLIKRLESPPKHHLADPALATSLLGLDASALLQGQTAGPAIPRDGTLLGSLFESLVTLSVRVYAQAAMATVKHCRAHAGRHEIDLIVERRDHRVLAMEVKLRPTVSDEDVRHLKWLQQEIGEELLDAVVITTGPYAYRRPDGVAVVPAALLGA
jgi:predicted AAA+ superfamily ATPase